jgi:hypothetical protein
VLIEEEEEEEEEDEKEEEDKIVRRVRGTTGPCPGNIL